MARSAICEQQPDLLSSALKLSSDSATNLGQMWVTKLQVASKLLVNGSAYGIRQGLSAGVLPCPPRAQFLVLLFIVCRQFLLFIAGVAVWVAVLLCSEY